MSTEQQEAQLGNGEGSRNRCPIDHNALSQQKTVRTVEPAGMPIECDEAGVWHVRGFEEARAILRSGDTKQAGFKAELFERLPGRMTPPILFQDGKAHHQQRKLTARYFAPKVVSPTIAS
jgi:cytochrome P450